MRSSIQSHLWPAVQTGQAATLLALQQQFQQTEFWPAEALRAAQFEQLSVLVEHAIRTIPFYAERLRAAGIAPGKKLTEAAWARIPILTRTQVRDNGTRLHASSIPPSHGGTGDVATGGSTGVPVRVRKTELAELMWQAVLIREELWHRAEPRAMQLRIKDLAGLPPAIAAAAGTPQGALLPDWGPPHNLLWQTGKMALIDHRQPIAAQAALLQRLRPGYLFTMPANLRLLLAHFRMAGRRLDCLRAVWTLSEVVDDGLRAACQAVFGCPIVHNYSAAETGYIALQCPQATHFHVQSETILAEVLDENNRPCAPGQTGRVVVTPLHNFAMPLLRYEVGDQAEVGAPCACGRGLPVLNQIVGRTVDALSLPSGQKRYTRVGHNRISKIVAVLEYQVIQRSLERIEVLMVLGGALTAAEDTEIRAALADELGSEFRIDLTFCDSIARTPAGKLRPFISDLPQEE